MSTIAELAPDRTVEGVYAVARKQRRTTRKGAPYLALELVDPTGRIEGRIWNDVELLDGRFAEGDAVRVLGRVERFDDRLQLEIRSVEASDDDPAGLLAAAAPRRRRARRVPRVPRGRDRSPGARRGRRRVPRPTRAAQALRELPAAETHHSYAGGLLEHTVGVATLVRETAQLHHDCARISSWRRRSCTTSGACASSGVGPRSGPPRRAGCSVTSTSACG